MGEFPFVYALNFHQDFLFEIKQIICQVLKFQLRTISLLFQISRISE